MILESRNQLSKAILITGLIAGTLDITAATIQFVIMTGKNPVLILWYIASAVLGKTSYEGGAATAILGLLFHYLIATTWTFFYFMLYPALEAMRRNWAVSGIAYGAFVWAGMNLVVVPLSRIPSAPLRLERAAVAMIILMVCIGLPIAYRAVKYFDRMKLKQPS